MHNIIAGISMQYMFPSVDLPQRRKDVVGYNYTQAPRFSLATVGRRFCDENGILFYMKSVEIHVAFEWVYESVVTSGNSWVRIVE